MIAALENKHAMAAMLLTAAELSAQIDASTTVVIDCRFDLLNPAAGRLAWEQGHLPGAYYAHLDEDLAAPIAADSGRHPLPDPEHFASLLGRWGVQPDSRVVLYDASGGAIAARLWWLLRWVGHDQVALLDGGLKAWTDENLPLSRDQPVRHEGRYPVRPGAMPVLDVDAVSDGLAAGTLVLLDARDKRRFAGEVEPIDTISGHIPGTLNRPFQANLDALGHFRATLDLQESFAALNVRPDQQLASMCGSGVTACHTIFSLLLAGVAGGSEPIPALYAGSWSEWIRSPERPVGTAMESAE